MSKNKTPNPPQETSQDISERLHRTRKGKGTIPGRARLGITPEIVKAIGTLQARHLLTAKEACLKADVNYGSWNNWLSKEENKLKYGDLLSRIRAERITRLVDEMDKHVDGKDGRRPDWRCARELLTLTDSRFADRQPEAGQSQANAALVSITSELIRRCFPSQPKPVAIDAEPVKELAATTNIPENGDNASK